MGKSLIRIGLAGAATATMLALTASPAGANSDKVIKYPDGRGKMTYFDDGDVFEVCDTKADGHGMTGILVDGSFRTKVYLEDGGDSGCGKKGYDVGNFDKYQMWLQWNKDADFTVKSEWFNE